MSNTTSIYRSPGKFALDPRHDARHRLKKDPLARESLVFMLQLPEHDLAAFVYTWVSGESKAGAALCVFGPAVGAEAIFDIVDGISVPEDQGFNDWRVGKVHVRHLHPLQAAEVTYAGESASLRYHFEAVHPAYNYGSHEGGCPAWVADDRFEQSGRVRGVLTVGGREIHFDTMGHRDHSWGTRDWGIGQHWKWLEAQAGDDLVVHCWELEYLGERAVRGYVLRDGRIAEITGVRSSFKHDQDLMHTYQESVIEDDAGRVTTVKGTTFATFEFKVSPLATLNECSMAVEIDGKPGVGHVEMFWPKAYLDYVRARYQP